MSQITTNEVSDSVAVFYALNLMATEVYEQAKSKGWYLTERTEDEFLSNALNNLHGEVSELWEAWRNKTLRLPCDKSERMESYGLPALTCLEEELADILIRVLDDAAHLGVDISRAVAVKHLYNRTRPHRHGGKLA